MTEKLSNPRVSCVNSDLTQNPPTFSIAPIHADEVTMNANARNPRRRFDSYPLRHFQVRSAECVVRNGGRLHSAFRTPHSMAPHFSQKGGGCGVTRTDP